MKAIRAEGCRASARRCCGIRLASAGPRSGFATWAAVSAVTVPSGAIALIRMCCAAQSMARPRTRLMTAANFTYCPLSWSV